MARALQALAAHEFPVVMTPPMEAFFRGFAAVQQFLPGAACADLLDPARCQAALDRLPDPVLRHVLSALVRTTAVPTVAAAGSKTNVIPGECSCEVDCRILPGQTPDELRAAIEAILDGAGCRDYAIDMVGSVASASPIDTELYRAVERSFSAHDGRARVLPYMSPGATDSRFFRKLGVPCYGLQMDCSTQAAELIHGHNERIAAERLTFGIKVLHGALKNFCYEGSA
jgi:acetylornithine deacetylase/succinyl-diaminopimelate desuccinylase-like protein